MVYLLILMKQIGSIFPRLLWLLMAFHMLWVGSEFPQVLEEEPVTGYTLSETKPLPSSSLKRINTLPGIPEKMTQEETLEHPDYVPLGLKARTALPGSVRVPSDKVIPFKEINRPQFQPDRHNLPPEVFHS